MVLDIDATIITRLNTGFQYRYVEKYITFLFLVVMADLNGNVR